MDVWDPNDKITVFSQIKKAINTPVSGFKRWSGMILPGILIGFYFFIFFLVLSGCAYFQKDKIEGREGEDDIIITDLTSTLENVTISKKIACIKLLPECND
jgi:hypothetical protein